MLAPSIALGAIDCSGKPSTFNAVFVCLSLTVMNGLIPLLLILAVVVLVAGIVKFVSAGDNEEKRQAGRQVMVYGIIVLFVMVSLWGFVNILTQSFLGKNFGIPNQLPKLMK